MRSHRIRLKSLVHPARHDRCHTNSNPGSLLFDQEYVSPEPGIRNLILLELSVVSLKSCTRTRNEIVEDSLEHAFELADLRLREIAVVDIAHHL